MVMRSGTRRRALRRLKRAGGGIAMIGVVAGLVIVGSIAPETTAGSYEEAEVDVEWDSRNSAEYVAYHEAENKAALAEAAEIEASIARYQEKQELEAVERFNEQAEALISETDARSIGWTADEAEWLVRIAEAEAGNQDLEGKALVICVVWNRVKSDKFPDTVQEVISQEDQFSSYPDSFNNCEPDEECYEALEMVGHDGWDESGGALYFEAYYNVSTWHKANLEYLFTHGDHIFYTERSAT